MVYTHSGFDPLFKVEADALRDFQQRGLTVLHSGGLDSSTLLALCVYHGIPVHALRVHYGQRHSREMHASTSVCESLCVKADDIFTADLRKLPEWGVIKGSSQLGDLEVPEGRYDEASMSATVVPNRNMMMLSVALAHAVSYGHAGVAYAAHAGDHAIYPDCRPSFVHAMGQAFDHASEEPMWLFAPFLMLSKADIATQAKLLRLPVELTYSCYAGREKHCGRCGTCVERLEALSLAYDGVIPDAERYEDLTFWQEALRGKA